MFRDRRLDLVDARFLGWFDRLQMVRLDALDADAELVEWRLSRADLQLSLLDRVLDR